MLPRSIIAGNISPSAIFRFVDAVQPTLLIDEADTFLRSNDEIRGMLNAAYVKLSAHIVRSVEHGNRQFDSKPFSTWGPKVIAGIGRFADTFEDRAIMVQMQRKAKDAQVARCRHRDTPEYAALRQQALRWAMDAAPSLRDARPVLPDSSNDRLADNWEPLLAIAEMAGEEWARRARVAACA
jgi:putative DNA primase/helicase